MPSRKSAPSAPGKRRRAREPTPETTRETASPAATADTAKTTSPAETTTTDSSSTTTSDEGSEYLPPGERTSSLNLSRARLDALAKPRRYETKGPSPMSSEWDSEGDLPLPNRAPSRATTVLLRSASRSAEPQTRAPGTQQDPMIIFSAGEDSEISGSQKGSVRDAGSPNPSEASIVRVSRSKGKQRA